MNDTKNVSIGAGQSSQVTTQRIKSATRRKTMIRLKNEQDITFSNIAQNARVTGAILPSGLQVPKNGDWRIQNNTVILRGNKKTAAKVVTNCGQETECRIADTLASNSVKGL